MDNKEVIDFDVLEYSTCFLYALQIWGAKYLGIR